MADHGEGPLKRVSTMGYGDRSDEAYDQWAEDYEADLTKYGYLSPQLVADALQDYVGASATVVDYACGTGLAGVELAGRGFTTIDGVDYSRGMLDIAASKAVKGEPVYRKLLTVDLTATIPIEDGAYDALICVGAMGGGHLAPEHLPELMRTIASGGIAAFYMNAIAYDGDGFAKRFAALETAGHWQIISETPSNYMAELDRPGMLVLAARP